jgi:hypothetical protein
VGIRFCLAQLTDETQWTMPLPGARFVALQAVLAYLYTDHLRIARFFLPDVRALAARLRLPRSGGALRPHWGLCTHA